MTRRQRDLKRFIVCLESFVFHLLKFVTCGSLSDVSVVVTYHLDEEGSWFLFSTCLLEYFGSHNIYNVLAVLVKRCFDLELVCTKKAGVLLILRVLLNR